MHPTQHSTIHRRGLMTRSPAPTSIECTHEDILDAIAQIAAKQQTQFVMTATLALSLGLNAEDYEWLKQALHQLDEQQRVMLNCVEYPQKLPEFIKAWFVQNASGIPCHEVCIAPDSRRLKPLLKQHNPELPVYRRAADSSTDNPTVQKRRISDLVKGAADTLFGNGHAPTPSTACSTWNRTTGGPHKMNCIAYCWSSGRIEFTPPRRFPQTPYGTIPIVSGPVRTVHDLVTTMARHGQGASSGMLLVPGIPEASSSDGKLAALEKFRALLKAKNTAA
ncbi:MAG: hypothetical protein WAW39_15950 [Prosthecobacter sp.]|uniref:hypothetical protein n=1 Tax=Prosthecobacter sp. TaxID=1965333 RepID=UPI003BAFB1B5